MLSNLYRRPKLRLPCWALTAVRNEHTMKKMDLRETVRRLDYDGYLCGLLLPLKIRPSYFAIRALNAEIATIKDSTHNNPITGQIRMQWWRERIFKLYEFSSADEERGLEESTILLHGLDQAIQKHDLTRRWFERLLDARDLDLNRDEVQNLAELETYAEQTASSLLFLTLECLGVRDKMADSAAEHAGVAIGLVTLLRGTPYHSSRKLSYLPTDIMKKHCVSVEDLVAAVEDSKLGEKAAPVVFDVACRAMEHLNKARSMQNEIPSKSRNVFLQLVSSWLYLKDLEAANFNAFVPELQQRNMFRLHIHVLKHYFLRKY
ncbi:Phytoene synthase [Plasmopara halstedii]|uniref:15-cis-phytoene synthase n=1 Tax=Plasmopara halstedii TaxID=4781 RepID=A0A0P1AA87_PLAHL|nr:Phytoene synthase [Plasmopara halstedii]CEG37048.1 Phytoene synthase [Plasmopara halstedii]|eukprot:XP_024573417.1 Phytoene synthase [Plasmopara halstedii]